MTEHYALVVVASVKPIWGVAIHNAPHLRVGMAILLAAWLFALRLSVSQSTEDMERLLGLAVMEGFDKAKLTVKEAAALMSWDESNLRKSLRGERGHHMNLTRLLRLPVQFWMWFLPVLTYLVMRQNVRDVAEDLRIIRRSA
jgi:hypothetical protein